MVDAVVGDDDRFAGLHGIHRAVAGDGDNSTYRHGFAHDVRGVVLFGNRQEFWHQYGKSVSVKDRVGVVVDFDKLIPVILFAFRSGCSGKKYFGNHEIR